MAAALGARAVAGEPSLDQRIAAVLPRADEEKWLAVDWRSELAAARFEANEARKPLFLWLMDGDPLGCT